MHILRLKTLTFAVTLLANSIAFSVDDSGKSDLKVNETKAYEPKTATKTATFTSPLSALSQEEKEAMGLDKLTQEQLDKLTAWIKQKYEKGVSYASTKAQPAVVDTAIKELKDEGRYLTLENGMQVEVTGSGRKQATNWKAADAIRVEQGSKKGWVKITHIPSGTRARCKVLAGQLQAVDQKSEMKK